MQLIPIVRYVTWETPAADTLLSSLRPKTADNEDGDDGDDDIDADGDDDDDDDGAPLWTQPYYNTSKNHISKRRRAHWFTDKAMPMGADNWSNITTV